MDNIQKAALGAFIVAVAITTIVPASANVVNVYAQTTEDDGYTYPDGASEEEKQEIDEREQQAWENAGRPGELDDNNDNGDNGNDQPYCDTDEGKAASSCFDRYDYDEYTGLYPCVDGSQVTNPKDCDDDNGSNNNRGQSFSNEDPDMWYESCRIGAKYDAPVFNREKYERCGLYADGDKAYSYGFTLACMNITCELPEDIKLEWGWN